MSDKQQGKNKILYKIGLCTAKYRKVILALAILTTVLAVLISSGALNSFSLARFQASGSESVQAAQIMQEEFDTGVSNLTVVVTAKNNTVDDPLVAKQGYELTKILEQQPEVTDIASYWSRDNSPVLRSENNMHALILARITGNATEAREAIAKISPKLTQDNTIISSQVGGRDEVFRQVSAQARQDFIRAELIILPAMALLLYVVFRRWSAALLTLGVGIFAVFSTLSLLTALLPFTEISTFALNLTLVMGLALGLDYSLLVISRYREQRQTTTQTKEEAIATAVSTAGHAVIFSGLTVAISLSALILFPFPFLQSFAYAGIGVVLTSIIGAVIILPAALALLGDRVLRPKKAVALNTSKSLWQRAALRIMKRPIIYGSIGLIIVLLLALPALDLQLGLPDDRILPETASSRQAQQQIRDNFVAEEADAIQIVTEPATIKPAQAESYASDLSEISGVAQVDYSGGSYANGSKIAGPSSNSERFLGENSMWFSVIPESIKLEQDAAGLVAEVRSTSAPFKTYVGGATAEMTDFRQALIARMPLVLIIILIATFVLLAIMTGSLLLPAIATGLNILSLSVMFGAIVWVFQQGNLSGILNFTATGYIEPTIPILMLCVAYGLSMDYQLFMLSRIKEIYATTRNNRTAVLIGLQKTAPIIIPAAIILAFTFSIYLISSITQLKMLALGMAVTVFIDATIIRLILLPASMELAGKANWWLPSWLKRT